MGKIRDLTGQQFGKLTVISFEKVKDRKALWKCQCECGEETLVFSGNLTHGITKTCGSNTHRQKHNMCNSRIYRIWKNMKNRCDSPGASRYGRYGGRGITYCAEWKEFIPFYEWAMNNGYDDKLTLDRMDNNGNYEPSNCRWVTHDKQMNNTKRNIYVEIDGVTKTLTEWAYQININPKTMSNRYKQGDRGQRLIRPLEKKYSPISKIQDEV